MEALWTFAKYGVFTSILFNLSLIPFKAEARNQKTIRGRVLYHIFEDHNLNIIESKFEIVDENTGRRYELKDVEKLKLQTGQFVSISGVENEEGTEFQVDTVEPILVAVKDSPPYYPNLGKRSVLVVMRDRMSCRLTDKYTRAEIEDLVFNKIHNLFMNSSFGQFGLENDFNKDGQSDIMILDTPETDTFDRDTLVEQATLQGYDAKAYSSKLVIDGCYGGGSSPVGCGRNSYDTYMSCVAFSEPTMRVVSHELGHSLGMHHASTDFLDAGQGYKDGFFYHYGYSAYGDRSDVMGASFSGGPRFNPPHTLQMGWYDALPGTLIRPTSSGVFRLYAMSQEPTAVPGPMAIQLGNLVESEDWFLSFRNGLSQDSGVPPEYLGGVNMHRWGDDLVGGKPEMTRFIRKLTDGGVFEDWYNNIRIEQIGTALDLSYVDVQLTFNDPVLAACQPQRPSITASIDELTLTAGEVGEFTLTITNNDQGDCPDTDFTLELFNQSNIYESEIEGGTLQTFRPGETKVLKALIKFYSAKIMDVHIEVGDRDEKGPTHRSGRGVIIPVTVLESTETCLGMMPDLYPNGSIRTGNTVVGNTGQRTIELRSRDPEGCPSSVYSVEINSDDPNLDVELDSHLVTLAPMESRTMTMTWFSNTVGEYTAKISVLDVDGVEPIHLSLVSSVEFDIIEQKPRDYEAPQVSIISPADGENVSGRIYLVADASDNIGVRSVSLLIDGVSFAYDYSYPYSFPIDTEVLGDGQHSFSVIATDLDNNQSTEDHITLQVNNSQSGGEPEPNPEPDTTPPIVSILEPVEGQTLAGLVNVRISASDNVQVDRVELFVDGTKVGSMSAPPYEIMVDTGLIADGVHSFVARAIDSSSNWNDSTAVNVHILNSMPPPPTPPEEDTESPLVAFISHSDGGLVAKSSTVTLVASASDNVSVSSLEILVNGISLCVRTSEPYSCLWEVPGGKPGVSYQVKAIAKDPSGNTGQASIQLTAEGSSGGGGEKGNNGKRPKK